MRLHLKSISSLKCWNTFIVKRRLKYIQSVVCESKSKLWCSCPRNQSDKTRNEHSTFPFQIKPQFRTSTDIYIHKFLLMHTLNSRWDYICKWWQVHVITKLHVDSQASPIAFLCKREQKRITRPFRNHLVFDASWIQDKVDLGSSHKKGCRHCFIVCSFDLLSLCDAKVKKVPVVIEPFFFFFLVDLCW